MEERRGWKERGTVVACERDEGYLRSLNLSLSLSLSWIDPVAGWGVLV